MILDPVIKQGYFINYQSTNKDLENKFCGIHDIEGATCPNCNKKLLRFFTIAKTSINCKEEFPYSVIHLLYCWTCSISELEFFYKIINSNRVELLEFKKGAKQKDFPYSGYPDYFPLGEVFLHKISERDQKIISDVNSEKIDEFDLDESDEGLCVPRHQIGGEPYLVQNELVDLRCPRCKLQMPFLAAVADDCLDKKGFVGNSYVQVLFHYCKNCNIVGSIQQCD